MRATVEVAVFGPKDFCKTDFSADELASIFGIPSRFDFLLY